MSAATELWSLSATDLVLVLKEGLVGLVLKCLVANVSTSP